MTLNELCMSKCLLLYHHAYSLAIRTHACSPGELNSDGLEIYLDVQLRRPTETCLHDKKSDAIITSTTTWGGMVS